MMRWDSRMVEESAVRYPLDPEGWISHWLRAGPVTHPLSTLAEVIRSDGPAFGRGGRWAISNAPDSLELKLRVYHNLPPSPWRPERHPALGEADPLGRSRWTYAATPPDRVIDFSLFSFTPTVMEAWLYAGILAEGQQTVSADLLTVGPARVWLNGRDAGGHVGFGYVEPATVPLVLSLAQGWNDLWVQGAMIAWREARLALGMRLHGTPSVEVALPVGALAAKQWHQAEATLSRLAVREFAFPSRVVRVWPDPEARDAVECEAEIIAVPAQVAFPVPGRTGAATSLMPPSRLRVTPEAPAEIPVHPWPDADRVKLPFEGGCRLRLLPAEGTPLVVEREIWLGGHDFRTRPRADEDYDIRRREALEHVSRMPHHVLGAMAAVAAGEARAVDHDAVAVACEFLEHRCDCADFYAIDLLVLLHYFDHHAALGEEDRRRIEAAFRGFKFWIDEPGVDAMCYHTENHQILFHVAAYLAGQRWPGAVFSNSGRTGQRQRRRAGPRIREWILRRLRGGFSEWDSNAYIALDAYAMLALVEAADSRALRGLAARLLHKIFFALACQSWRGVHGSSHGRVYVTALKTARAESTSGPQRIAWGLGTFNGEARATGLLALARRYRVPDILQRIGADLPDLLVTRARSSGRYRPQFDLRHGAWEVNTLTRRTPDYMLSAALDHRPGARGIQEHIWQATLGPEAVVFTTHPGNSQEHESARPNFWAGSARLPRVAMHDDVVIALYNLTLGGGMGYTHAYFPVEAFDEHVVDGQWAFARRGDGYVALWGDGSLRLTSRGPHAGQELRSVGPGQVWVCRAGGSALDGEFSSFCRQTRARAPQAEGLSVRWVTPAGRSLAFAWDGPLSADGAPIGLGAFPLCENLYTSTPMDADLMHIVHDDQRLVLDLTA
jgi:hypothetical protein